MQKKTTILIVVIVLILILGIGIFWYVKINNGNVALSSVLSGLGGTPGSGQQGTPGHLTVRGSQIIAPDGQPIVLRGFNWGPISDTSQPQDGRDNAAQGANFVRIPLSWYSSNRLDTTDCSGGALDYDPNAPGTIPPA
ncbi:hypothetical protein H0X32_02750, partial [Patescibacteria group bacterium]|nr:hypothetical protein [Patescibacteria group bacterium]